MHPGEDVPVEPGVPGEDRPVEPGVLGEGRLAESGVPGEGRFGEDGMGDVAGSSEVKVDEGGAGRCACHSRSVGRRVWCRVRQGVRRGDGRRGCAGAGADLAFTSRSSVPCCGPGGVVLLGGVVLFAGCMGGPGV